jgi:hypothetical protein
MGRKLGGIENEEKENLKEATVNIITFGNNIACWDNFSL